MSVSSISSNEPDITQSRFLLAKYRIQVVDPEKIDQPPKTSQEEIKVDLEELHHYHGDPIALECKKIGTESPCDVDNCIRCLWCCYMPFLCLNEFFLSCFGHCCSIAAEATTDLEESYTLTDCFCCECCKLAA